MFWGLFTFVLSQYLLWMFFSEYDVWYEILLALFMHLIPAFILIGSLILAWKKKLVGGIVYLVLTLLFTRWFDLYESWQGFLLIGMPLLVISGLFLLAHKFEK